MIRLLILLVTLNAIFPIAGLASVCASNSSEALNTALVSSSNMAKDTNHSSHSQTSHSQSGNTDNITVTDNEMIEFQSHCDDPQMSCNDQNMTLMDCDSGCCVSCLGVSATMTPSLFPALLAPTHAIKPVSGYINYYTRSISPELQPPLV